MLTFTNPNPFEARQQAVPLPQAQAISPRTPYELFESLDLSPPMTGAFPRPPPRTALQVHHEIQDISPPITLTIPPVSPSLINKPPPPSPAPAPSPLSSATALPDTLSTSAAQSTTKTKTQIKAHQHRHLTPQEARHLTLLLRQHLSAHKHGTKGLMEEAISLASKLHEAGIRWDKYRRVMGMHLRGIWEEGGGRWSGKDKGGKGQDLAEAMDSYVQSSFLTIAEDPHPLDPTPLPIPLLPSSYASLPFSKLTLQAGLLGSLPVSMDLRPLPLTGGPQSGGRPCGHGYRHSISHIPTPTPTSNPNLGLGFYHAHRSSISSTASLAPPPLTAGRGRASSLSALPRPLSAVAPIDMSLDPAGYEPGSSSNIDVCLRSAATPHLDGSSVDQAYRPSQAQLSQFRLGSGHGNANGHTHAALQAHGQYHHQSFPLGPGYMTAAGVGPGMGAVTGFELHAELGKDPKELRRERRRERWNERKKRVGLSIRVESYSSTKALHHRPQHSYLFSHIHGHSHGHPLSTSHLPLSVCHSATQLPYSATLPTPMAGQFTSCRSAYSFSQMQHAYAHTPVSGRKRRRRESQSHSRAGRGGVFGFSLDLKVGKKRIVLGVGRGGGRGGPRSARRVSFGGWEVR